MKIVFFGTPEFAVASLDRIIAEGHDVRAVVTMPDKIGRRGHGVIESDVKKYALQHNLPLLQPEKLKNPEFLEQLRALDADIFVVIAFRMLPEAVWAMPPKGTFNLHASLLPKFRGAAPINRAIMAGETRTGVTTFFLKHEIDTGDIIEQREINILPEDNAGSIHDRLMLLGADMVANTLRDIEAGTVKTHPQPEGDFSPAPKIFADDCTISWNATAADIHNLVRGLSPYPAARSRFLLDNGKELDIKIFETAIADDADLPKLSAGQIVVNKEGLFVGTSDSALQIIGLQPAGKKRMDAKSFLLGYHPQKAL